MSKFFVGQKVRLARPHYPENEGMRGVIAELYPESQLAITGTVNCAVDWENGTRDSRSYELGGLATHTDQLEPILDQHTPANLSSRNR